MNDSVLSQFAPRSAVSRLRPDAESDSESLDDFVSFGYARGSRERVEMIEFRWRDGSMMALGYYQLERIEYNPSGCITLRFAKQTVRVHGRNLNAEIRPNVRLVGGLVRHKISFIQESSSAAAMAAGQEATIIEQIELE